MYQVGFITIIYFTCLLMTISLGKFLNILNRRSTLCQMIWNISAYFVLFDTASSSGIEHVNLSDQEPCH